MIRVRLGRTFRPEIRFEDSEDRVGRVLVAYQLHVYAYR